MTNKAPCVRSYSNRFALEGGNRGPDGWRWSSRGTDALAGRAVPTLPLLIAKRDVALEPCSS